MLKTAIALTLLSFSSAVIAAEADLSKKGPWTRTVAKKDEKGIDTLYKIAEEAMHKQDLNAALALQDFPVFMMTDNSKGDVYGKEWTKEIFVKEMGPYYAAPLPKDMKHELKKQVHFLSETLAVVIENHKQTMGKQANAWTSSSTVILKDGKWLFKTVSEAGWGDEPQTAAAKVEQKK